MASPRPRLTFATILWASQDADREWRETVGPAFLYQQRKYREREGDAASAGGYAPTEDLDELRPGLLVGPPAEVAERLRALNARYPFDEVAFWARLPGVPIELAIEHVERVGAELNPALRGSSGHEGAGQRARSDGGEGDGPPRA